MSTYQADQLRELAFPLGGIGTGCISLEGRGSLRDWEIFNRPNKGTILPDTFAALWCKPANGPAQCRVVQGPPNKGFLGNAGDGFYQSYGFGMTRSQGDGLPHFASARFTGSFPFARLAFHQPGFPLQVELTAFNPFIPLDHESSSFPVACLVYKLTNPSPGSVEASLAFSLLNATGLDNTKGGFSSKDGDQALNTFQIGKSCRGLVLTSQRYPAEHPSYGTMALTTDWPEVTVLPHWLRKPKYGWFDPMHHFWDTFGATGRFATSSGSSEDTQPGNSVSGSLGLVATIAPGQSVELPFLISWCFPNAAKYWGPGEKMPEAERPRWTNAYASRWPTAWQAAEEFFTRRAELTSRTRAFEQALHKSTLPGEVLESVSATASILHSPTCLQYADGTFWGWEGCAAGSGCCEGSCTHVWNYALTQAYLFPALQRSMRQAEYKFGFDPDDEGKKGAVTFRVTLPLGEPNKRWHAASDGQLGGIVQLYRDWRNCGDDGYLKAMWPPAKRALEYAWAQWDRDQDGLVEGDQHNTYDINFQGPNPLTQFFYLAALKAGECMARYLGDLVSADLYARRYESGAEKTRARLFNGEYFEQTIDCLAPEAPKYQHGKGCLSDQVFGQLSAHVAGLGHLLDPDLIRSALAAIMRYNFRAPLGDHANMQRIYAVSDESGLVLCTWPKGSRPAFPFPYSDEVWTGIEYQVASHLIYEGMVEDALQIVRAIRVRHDGRRRNPYNEFECGSHYARALSAWGLLLSLSGFRYDAVDKTIHLTPRGPKADAMKCFFTAGTAWGVFTWRNNKLKIEVREGSFQVDRIVTPAGEIIVPAKGNPLVSGKPRWFKC